MRGIRTRLAGIAAAILLLQVMATAVSSISACCAQPPAAADMKCCKDGGSQHICPLMTKSADSASRCQMRACGARHDESVPFSTLIGLVVPKTAFVLQPRSVSGVEIVASPVRLAPIPPSPPPRLHS